MNLTCTFYYRSCGGDSGAPLIGYETDLETFEIKFKLFAILHGGIVNCDNSVYPALYNRITEPNTYQWILDKISSKVSK